MVDFLLVEEGVLGASASGRRFLGLDGEDADLPRASPGEPLGASASGRRSVRGGLDGEDADLPRAERRPSQGESWGTTGSVGLWPSVSERGGTARTPTFPGRGRRPSRVGPGNHWERRPLAVGFWGWTARTPTFPGRGRRPSRASPGEPLGASASGRRSERGGVDGEDADPPRPTSGRF